MSWIAVAVGAGASLIGGAMSSSAAGKAAKAQEAGADKAAEVQRYMYNQTRADQGPYRDVGANALYRLADHYGLGYGAAPGSAPSGNAFAGGGAAGGYRVSAKPKKSSVYSGNSSFIKKFLPLVYDEQTGRSSPWLNNKIYPAVPAKRVSASGGGYGYGGGAGRYSAGGPQSQKDAWGNFFTSPDYQFKLDEGIRGIENSMLSRGKGLSGNTAKAITGYAGDLASGEWNNYANRLASLAGIGQTATNQLGQIGSATAANIGNANIAAGQARGSGYIGQSDAWGNALGNVAGMAGWGNWGGGSSSPNWLNTASGSAYGTNPYSQQSMMLANQWG